MDDFAGKLAVVTGGGSGMGRELVLQLAEAGCSVAACDVFEDNLAETKAQAPDGVTITTHVCDVSDEAQVERFRDEVVEQHGTDHVHLVFNNAGVGGGGSFVTGEREQWDRTFAICWGGVYHCTRAFLPLLIAAPEGVLVNTSSVNGFWANLGRLGPHTAYSTAKFAVKGFSEALITDLAVNAPHVKVAVVMPGHIGTGIVQNSIRLQMGDEIDPEIREQLDAFGNAFRENAPMTAAEAATVILEGVREGRWRILIGEDARRLDQRMRSDPDTAYDDDGFETITFPGA